MIKHKWRQRSPAAAALASSSRNKSTDDTLSLWNSVSNLITSVLLVEAAATGGGDRSAPFLNFANSDDRDDMQRNNCLLAAVSIAMRPRRINFVMPWNGMQHQ